MGKGSRLLRIARAAVVLACVLPFAFAAWLGVRRARGAAPPDALTPTCRGARAKPQRLGTDRRSSPVAMVSVGDRDVAFVADTDAEEIVAFDLRDAHVLARHRVGGSPSHVLFGDDGLLYVVAREASAVRIFEVDASAIVCDTHPVDYEPVLATSAPTSSPGTPLLRARGEIATPDEPVAMALTPDGAALVVVSGWGHTLSEYATTGRHAKLREADLPREPRSVALDAAGTRAFVSHATGPVSVVDLVIPRPHARSVALEGHDGVLRETRGGFDVLADAELAQFGMIGLLNSGNSDGPMSAAPPPSKTKRLKLGPRLPTQGFAIVTIATGGIERVLVPETLVQPGRIPEDELKKRSAPRATGYGVFDSGEVHEPTFGPATAHIAVIDAKDEAAEPASMLLTVQDGTCLLPRAAAVDDVKQTIFVACLGTNEIDEYGAREPSPTSALRARWTVPSGPTGITLDEQRLVVWSAFDRILTIIDRQWPAIVLSGSPTRERKPTPFEVGRKIFHASGNLAIASDGRTCASCHPDGRDDGVTWSSPDGPRQTPMLAGRLAETAPFGWTAASPTVREHLNLTLQRLGGRGLSPGAMYALLTYLARMPAPPRGKAALRDPEMVARGRAIFESYDAGCSGCHEGRATTDGQVHDVRSATRGETEKALATPSLAFVGGTAPYFHDGRYATLGDLLRASDGKMGNTAHLGDRELEELTAYLKTL